MKKKITELNKPPFDENSPSGQEFLWKLHNEIIELHKDFKKMYENLEDIKNTL
jgi:hypothetical protein